MSSLAEKFVQNMNFEQIKVLKRIVDYRFEELKKFQKSEYEKYSIKELKSIQKKYMNQSNNVRNNREYDELQIYINLIDEILSDRKNIINPGE